MYNINTKANMTNLPLLQIPKGANEFYDSIMVDIEPDLVLGELPKLKEKYKDESPKSLKERGMRYYEAFQKFNEMLKVKTLELDDKAHELHSFVIGALENLSKGQDDEDCNQIETHIKKIK